MKKDQELEVEGGLESVEDLQKAMAELNAKLVKAEAKEDEAERVVEEFPIADIMLKIEQSTTIPIKGVTPPEVLLLVAIHNKGAKGNPIKEIKPSGTAKVDPIMLRAILADKYGAPAVMAMFPGTEPNFPKTFRRAMTAGIGAQMPGRNLMDFRVEPMGTGE